MTPSFADTSLRSESAITALVMDDDPIARRIASAALHAIGITSVVEAADGVAALAQLHDQSLRIDLALCDLEMEGMDGVEFIAQLCTEEPRVALIVVSGQDRAVIESVEGMAKSLGLRVLGALQKPLNRDRLAGLIARLNVVTGGSAKTGDFFGQISMGEIRAALESRSFIPYFQPRIQVATGELIGCEALIRWKHPRLGVIPPHRFIPLAQDTGQLVDITWRMLELTLRSLSDWMAKGLEISVSVNIPAEFFEELAVTENIVSMAARQGVPLSNVTLEIAEQSAALLDSGLIGNLARLRLRGIRLVIDDFGTGYASMQQLSRIPFTGMSVDRSFVYGAARNPNIRAILESSLALGRRLGLHTTAEGVETREELAVLRELDCDSAQGNLISPPIDGDAFWFWADGWRSTVGVSPLGNL